MRQPRRLAFPHSSRGAGAPPLGRPCPRSAPPFLFWQLRPCSRRACGAAAPQRPPRPLPKRPRPFRGTGLISPWKSRGSAASADVSAQEVLGTRVALLGGSGSLSSRGACPGHRPGGSPSPVRREHQVLLGGPAGWIATSPPLGEVPIRNRIHRPSTKTAIASLPCRFPRGRSGSPPAGEMQPLAGKPVDTRRYWGTVRGAGLGTKGGVGHEGVSTTDLRPVRVGSIWFRQERGTGFSRLLLPAVQRA